MKSQNRSPAITTTTTTTLITAGSPVLKGRTAGVYTSSKHNHDSDPNSSSGEIIESVRMIEKRSGCHQLPLKFAGADKRPQSSNISLRGQHQPQQSSSRSGFLFQILLGIIIIVCSGIGTTSSIFSKNAFGMLDKTTPLLHGNSSTYDRRAHVVMVHPLEQMKQTQAERIREIQKEKRRQITTLPVQDTTDESPFMNLPPPPTIGNNDKDSFAACLLIKDDNHWLIEWLAYHYFVMPLRNLIVTIDPTSRTSPQSILKRWSDRKLIHIELWHDVDFMPQNITAKAKNYDNNARLMLHRVRQTNFYRRCISTFREKGLDWLMMVDTDEFVLPSYASGYFGNVTSRIPFEEPGSVLRALQYQEQITRKNQTCVYMPRFFFGSKTSSSNKVQHLVSEKLDAKNMLTQNFLFRNSRQNNNGKNLLHLQRVPNIRAFRSVHHISKSYCPDPDRMQGLNQNRNALIRVHHYLGTKEQYVFREDPRDVDQTSNSTTAAAALMTYHVRGEERYDKLNKAANHEDHAAKAWIRGFALRMGITTAAKLLHGVGKVEGPPRATLKRVKK